MLVAGTEQCSNRRREPRLLFLRRFDSHASGGPANPATDDGHPTWNCGFNALRHENPVTQRSPGLGSDPRSRRRDRAPLHPIRRLSPLLRLRRDHPDARLTAAGQSVCGRQPPRCLPERGGLRPIAVALSLDGGRLLRQGGWPGVPDSLHACGRREARLHPRVPSGTSAATRRGWTRWARW
jgi:hypothetical protein